MTIRGKVILSVGLSALFLLPACIRHVTWPAMEELIRIEFPSVRHISTDSLALLIDQQQVRPRILDVRSREEYAVSHIPGAEHVGDDPSAWSSLDSLDRATAIVAYCSVGYRSSALAEALQARGFTHVVNVEGSIFKWANEGRPVVRDSIRVHDVHPYDAVWGSLLDRSLRTYAPRASPMVN